MPLESKKNPGHRVVGGFGLILGWASEVSCESFRQTAGFANEQPQHGRCFSAQVGCLRFATTPRPRRGPDWERSSASVGAGTSTEFCMPRNTVPSQRKLSTNRPKARARTIAPSNSTPVYGREGRRGQLRLDFVTVLSDPSRGFPRPVYPKLERLACRCLPAHRWEGRTGGRSIFHHRR